MKHLRIVAKGTPVLAQADDDEDRNFLEAFLSLLNFASLFLRVFGPKLPI
jgi:hypothetical protein